MGMGAIPCNGLVLRANEENMKKLGVKESLESIEERLMENPEVQVEIVLNGKPDTAWAFKYYEESGDRYDDLEEGVYFTFGDEELYEKKLSPYGQALKEIGCFPEEAAWTVWG